MHAENYGQVLTSIKKYLEVWESMKKYEEVQRSTRKYLVIPIPFPVLGEKHRGVQKASGEGNENGNLEKREKKKRKVRILRWMFC